MLLSCVHVSIMAEGVAAHCKSAFSNSLSFLFHLVMLYLLYIQHFVILLYH